MTSIEKTENAIKNNELIAKAYRVYKLTCSPVHLQYGADFMLYMSFDDAESAQAAVNEINASGFEIATMVHNTAAQ